MRFDFNFWIRFSLYNLGLVALLGVLMRYKIAFEFPFADQKNLQNAHSHFAFAGWIGQTLMVLMVYCIKDIITPKVLSKYKMVFALNLISSYGILLTFLLQGYNFASVGFSILNIVISYFFAFYFYRDTRQLRNAVYLKWFQAALFFNVISSLGVFYLLYVAVTHNFSEKLYLASNYYYLHFQYNGWFWFAAIGIFLATLTRSFKLEKQLNFIFWCFALTCIPTYVLSLLWIDIPLWLLIFTALSAFVQLFAWFKFIGNGMPFASELFLMQNKSFNYFYATVGFCVSLKSLLQLGSVIPQVSKLVYGFRPILIAYLHLVLLAIFTIFLLLTLFAKHFIVISANTKKMFLVFVIGIFLNEIVLAIQGIASFQYTAIPYANEMLFAIAAMLFLSISLLIFFSTKKEVDL